MLKKIVLITILLLSGNLFSGEYTNLKDLWLNNQIDHITFISKSTELISSSSFNNLEQARIYIDMGLADFYLENADESILKLEKAQELIIKNLEIRESSEAWGLLAESGSYIMLQKGLSYIISNSPKVKEYGEKAIALNPNNYRAIVIDAQGLINAPKIFGGDKKRGIENLRQLLENPMDKQDKFFVLMALSQSLVQDKKTREEGIKYAKEALKLYPSNIEALKIIN